MLLLSAALSVLCLTAIEPDASASVSVRPARKPYEVASPAEPSEARRAAIASTLAKRRAYRRRIRGSADRQLRALGPSWSQVMSQAIASAEV